MILPIYAFGHPVLKQVGKEIDANYTDLKILINNMWDTMYNAHGVGLAAPQIGLAIRLFVIDTIQIQDEDEPEKGQGFKKVFINAKITEQYDKVWGYEEGCLSIPGIRGDVERPGTIRIQYQDENFVQYDEIYKGIDARVIQHEYDHIEGVLFTEKLKPLKKKLISRKLDDIKNGKGKADYKVKYSTGRVQ
jgi:peptide deformylase